MHSTARLIALSLTALLAPAAWAAPAPSRTAVLLAINDVYRIEGVENATVGGTARVRALRVELERQYPDLVVLHAGDLLYPSFASRMFDGEQMIAALNALDGSEAAFDSRLLVTFGNHEFEKPKRKHAPLLAQRVAESQFRWLAGNFRFATSADGKPLVGGSNVIASTIVESGGLKLGLFGLTIPTEAEYVVDWLGWEGVARKLSAELRAQGAEVVVAVTHLNHADDRRLLERLGADGPDLIVGGHDHEKMAVEVGGRWLLKADADARTALVVRLTKAADGKLGVAFEHKPLVGSSPAPDPAAQALVDRWQGRHEREFCAAAGAASGCLGEVYGRTRTVLEAEENKIRSRETGLGSWLADRMLEAFAACGAQVAFVNSGSLRLNQDLAAGSAITRRHVEELFAYPTPLYLIRLDGATLAQVTEQAARPWPGSGSWLQIAGFSFVHDTTGRATRDVRLGGKPLLPDAPVLAVTTDFLLNPEIGDQDGYAMLGQKQIVPCTANGRDLKAVTIQALQAAEPNGIAPEASGRVRQVP
jgi:2',3'-cyclic-nucleotide 2'-phosphodiesterase (5'-nucleotidase family)